jgi:hypothetical protein
MEESERNPYSNYDLKLQHARTEKVARAQGPLRVKFILLVTRDNIARLPLADSQGESMRFRR